MTSTTSLLGLTRRGATAAALPSSSWSTPRRSLHSSLPLRRTVAGKYKLTVDRSKPLTYEMSFKPDEIAHKKGHNSLNTAQLEGTFLHKEEMGQDLPYKMAVEDMFIRKFLHGTWPEAVASEVVIKRQHNLVRVAFVLVAGPILPTKVYFLIGYTEELLSYWLKCPVRLEIQTIEDREEMVFKYI